jgi:hypothetical protein
MKTYKCEQCTSEATHRLSFKDMTKEVQLGDDVGIYAVCRRHVSTDNERFYYPTIEEYTALRAMYEL